MDEKDKRINIEMLQALQRDINFYKKVNENNQNPSLEKIIDTLRNSQDKLYGALSQHGITAEEVHKIILENSDKQIVAEIMKLQGARDKINNQLTDPNLSPEKCQSLEKSLTRTNQAHTNKWNEIINSPRKNELIEKMEQAIIKKLEKDRDPDRTRDYDRSR